MSRPPRLIQAGSSRACDMGSDRELIKRGREASLNLQFQSTLFLLVSSLSLAELPAWIRRGGRDIKLQIKTFGLISWVQTIFTIASPGKTSAGACARTSPPRKPH